MPKYNTFTELAAAFKSGELDPEKYRIRLDKSGYDAKLTYYDKDASDVENDKKYDECDALFRTRRSEDNVSALLTEIGIPNEWC